MPYKLFKQGAKFCVKNSDTGENKGCSDTRAMAVGHMRAMYAAEGGAKMGKKEIEDLDALITKELDRFNLEFPPTEDEVKELEELKTKHYGYYEYYVPWGITSFADLDSWREAQETAYEIRKDSDAFISMVDNILSNTEIPNKMKAVKALADEYESRTNSTLSGSGEYKKETDADITAPASKKSIKDRVFDALKEIFNYKDDIPVATPEEDEENVFTWYDKETGKWRWLARYSNNFLDRDNPPEIISSDSHRRFVELVDKGLAPLPDAWLWHIKNWKLGTATWVAYDDAGFSLSAGDFDEGNEQVAEWLSKQKGWKVSHGMPPQTIKRDPNDSRIIIEHETREISFLPGTAAANELTDFISLKKEDEMSIPDDKKKALISQWGLPADLLDKLELKNAQDAQKATSEGLESKEKTETPTETPPTETPPAEKPAETPTETPVDQKPNDDLDKSPTRKEVGEAFAGIINEQADRVGALEMAVKALTENVGVLAQLLQAQEKTKEEQAQATIKSTPMASLAALLTNSAIGDKSTQIDGRSSLAQSKPKEAAVPQEHVTGIPFLDAMLAAPAGKPDGSQ